MIPRAGVGFRSGRGREPRAWRQGRGQARARQQAGSATVLERCLPGSVPAHACGRCREATPSCGRPEVASVDGQGPADDGSLSPVAAEDCEAADRPDRGPIACLDRGHRGLPGASREWRKRAARLWKGAAPHEATPKWPFSGARQDCPRNRGAFRLGRPWGFPTPNVGSAVAGQSWPGSVSRGCWHLGAGPAG